MKRNLLNTKIKNFAKLEKSKQDDVLYITENFLKPNKELRVASTTLFPKVDDLWALKFSDMINLKDLVENKEFENVIKLMYEVDDHDIKGLSLFNALSTYKYIVQELKEIVKAEEIKLSNEPTQKEINAGIDDFQEFGQYNTLRMLTGGDKTKEKHWLELPYSEVFLELCYLVAQSNYQKRLYKTK